MKIIKFLALLILLSAYSVTYATIRYVNINATGANNGTSWADAYTDLQIAIASPADTLWVANGVYKPTTTTDRTITFNLGNRSVYGGFAGTETTLNQRNYSTFQTVLSGDIGVAGDSTDNSYHVVTGVSIIDGFKIINGNANETTPPPPFGYIGGGGVLVMDGIANIANCMFEHNYGTVGGAVFLGYANPGVGYPSIANVIFANNSAAEGGAIYVMKNQATLNGCSFIGNKGDYGGALSTTAPLSFTTVTVNSCNFYNNTAIMGGVVTPGAAANNFNKCIFSGNYAHRGGVLGTNFFDGASPIFVSFSNCLMAGNTADSFSVVYMGPNTVTTPPQSTRRISIGNSTIADNKTLDGSGRAISLNPSSFIRNTIIWNNVDVNNQTSANPIYRYAVFFGGQYHYATLERNIIQNTTLANNFSADPLFINPGNVTNAPFDAVNYNYRLDTLSPAIDTGDNTVIAVNSTDLGGNLRVQGWQVDLGAYERYHCPAAVSGGITASGPTSFCAGSSVSLTGPAGGTNYYWSNGATTNTITVSTAGNYGLVVVDAAGCISQFQKQVTILPGPSLYLLGNNFFCENGQTTITANGNSTSYLWSNGSTANAITINQPGDYYVTGTSIYGCSGTSDTISVQEMLLPTVTITGDTFLCQNGETTLTASGSAASYLWNNGETTSTVIIDQPGNYHVVAENNGCSTFSDTISVQEIALPTVAIAGDTFFCENGSGTLTASGSATSYLWNNGGNTAIITVTQPGNYYVTASNSFGCSTISDTISVQEIALPTVTISGDTFFCTNGTTALTATGNANTYLWNNGSTTSSIAVNQAGVYFVTGTNTYGCNANSDTVSVQEIALPTVTIAGDTFFCEEGSVILTVSGNATSYLWSNGLITDTISVTQSGDYFVTGTNDYGCSTTSDTISILEIVFPTVNITGDSTLCEGSSTTLTVNGNAVSFLWNTGSTTDTIVAIQPGTYFVTGMNDNQCTATDTIHLTLASLPNPTIIQYGNALGTEIFSAYQWIEGNTDIPGAVGQIYVPTADGVYKVRVTNAQGCEGVSEPFNFTLTGIHETYDQSGLQVYPNPAKDHLTIDVTALDDKVESYTIYNIVGKAIVQQEKVSAGKTFEINLPAALANGNYILQLNTNKEAYRAKFLIRK